MKTFRIVGMTIMAVMLSFTMSSCDNDDDVDPYKGYPQLIVGKWFIFTPDASGYIDFQADGTYKEVAHSNKIGWMESAGSYRFDGNRLINTMSNSKEYSNIVEITQEKLVYKAGGNPERPDYGESILYRVKEQFDIKGNYSYLNSVVRVVPAEGKTALQLPEGVLFQGQNSIPVDAMHGDRIIDVMKKFFADATFAADGKLNHTLDGEAKVKNYTLSGNNLVFNLYEGSDTYKVNATSFPDEDGDRLFIIIPKQAAWLGGMVDLVEKENAGLKLDAAQIAALEKEFMATFETFTVILSLSKK